METKTLSLLEEFTQIIGISGDEKQVSQALAKQYESLCDEIVYDNLGSIFAVKRCGKPDAKRVMVCAHMDEVGFMITEIHNNGTMSFIKIGSIDDASMHAQRVKVKANREVVYGTIIAEDEAIQKCNGKAMRIDVGAKSAQEVKEMGIHVGDSVVLDGPFQVLGKGKRVISKAFQNRFGCVLGIELLEALKGVTLPFDLYVGASVMEEVGIRGGITATGLIQPDLGIVLDCSMAQDVKGNENANGKLGEGVLIRYYDKGMMPNRGLLQAFETLCEKEEIKHQPFYSMGQNDAAWIHKLFSGCPTLNICICARNGHTASTMIDLNDYSCAKQSAISFVKQLDEKQIQYYKEFNR